MSENPILKPKDYFFGDHLTSALTQIYRTPMTVITAPYGYGKEIAVSYYTRTVDAVTLWINVPEDAGDGYFWEVFRGVFSEMNAEIDFSAAFLCQELPRNHVMMNDFIDALRSVLSSHNRETAVVINNFQLLPNMNAVYQFLRNIAACFLPNFHIVLLSTHFLPVSASDSMNGTVKRIGKSLFCLDEEGVRRFFGSYGIDLSEDDIKQAAAFGEGCLSVLSELAIVALERKQFDDTVISEARQRMGAYVKESAWLDLPEVARRFLTIMSVTDEFTAEQAKYICMFSGAGIDLDAMLKLLAGRHILDVNENGSYRMHNLLLALAKEEARKLPPAVVRKLVLRTMLEDGMGEEMTDAPNAAAQLTAREWEVLPLLREGKKNSEIAQCLYISENTVKSLLKSIYKKLGVHGRKELTE
jgi:ATP/maltotriose-dependent transcriptional regulator MalT